MSPTVLGINLSHTGAACVLAGGEIRGAGVEERLSRIKGDAGFPIRAIEHVLRASGVGGDEIDVLAVGTLCERFQPRLAQQREYRPLIRAVGKASALAPLSLLGSRALRGAYRGSLGILRRRETRHEHLPTLRDMGIRPRQVLHFDHHDCHSAATFHLRPFDDDATLLTCDGLGDGLAATVSVGRKGAIHRVASTSSVHSLGSMYSRVTRCLGFKPWEHEGKVMGLAPYADPERAEELARDFERFLEVDRLEFRNRLGLIGDSFIDHVAKRYGTHRFDDLAFAIQGLAELRLREWAEQAVRATGVRKICAAGGVFLNVKANAGLVRSHLIDNLYVFPAPGDESVAIGAALLAHLRQVGGAALAGGAGERPFARSPSIFWGPDVSEGIDRSIRDVDRNRFEVTWHGDRIDSEVAVLLAEGEIVGRARGRLEFGPRALGNRSILADPSRLEAVGELNRAIKNRDFWMPFAPAIAAENSGRYIHNSKGIDSPHMMLTFETVAEHRNEIAAAIHP
ncbi:MAG: hypothetical protein CME06_06255, partial [Gemmatimonadetes bacterium]|nr:hypothetical protein [Gemmatimonadota bacterium]